jgi:hypothetical protein
MKNYQQTPKQRRLQKKKVELSPVSPPRKLDLAQEGERCAGLRLGSQATPAGARQWSLVVIQVDGIKPGGNPGPLCCLLFLLLSRPGSQPS